MDRERPMAIGEKPHGHHVCIFPRYWRIWGHTAPVPAHFQGPPTNFLREDRRVSALHVMLLLF